MLQLELLQAGRASAVLAFELDNRSYFATSISDRGDAFFKRFDDGFASLLADQARGEGIYYVVVDDGQLVARVNLYVVSPGVANLGYRVAERAAGRGVATRSVAQLCRRVATMSEITTLRGAVSNANVASQRVLLANGFTRDGVAAPADLGGKSGWWYERALS